MIPNIFETIKCYFDKSMGDENHRYKSWEHCYSHFEHFLNSKVNEKTIDLAALHLAFYLASWGMYRGSSFLLQKDYKVHHKTVKALWQHKHFCNPNFLSISNAEIGTIADFLEQIKKCYPDNNVTDILSTKIALGTLGCAPAYDKYFKEGVKVINQSYKPHIKYSTANENSMTDVVRFYKQHTDEFKKAQSYIKNKSGIAQPAMKLVDMYFWEVGFNR